MLTDPLEGGEGSCCRVCGGHADDDPLRGLAGGEVAGSAAAGTASGRLRSANPSCPSVLGSFTGTSGLGLSNRIRKCVHRNVTGWFSRIGSAKCRRHKEWSATESWINGPSAGEDAGAMRGLVPERQLGPTPTSMWLAAHSLTPRKLDKPPARLAVQPNAQLREAFFAGLDLTGSQEPLYLPHKWYKTWYKPHIRSDTARYVGI